MNNTESEGCITLIVGFCASEANSGKTTLLLKVMAELRRRQIKVGVIKHGRHMDIDPDKDSSRYAAAGAEASIFISPQGWIWESRPDEEMAIEKAASLLTSIGGCEVVLVEGYKNAAIDKIAVCRSNISLTIPHEGTGLIAVVSDTPLATELPQFRFEEVEGLCDFILEACAHNGK